MILLAAVPLGRGARPGDVRGDRAAIVFRLVLRAHRQRRIAAPHRLHRGDRRDRGGLGGRDAARAGRRVRPEARTIRIGAPSLARSRPSPSLGWILFIGAVASRSSLLSARGRSSSRCSCRRVCRVTCVTWSARSSLRSCSGCSSPHASSCAASSRRCAPDFGRSRHCVEAAIVATLRAHRLKAPTPAKLGRGWPGPLHEALLRMIDQLLQTLGERDFEDSSTRPSSGWRWKESRSTSCSCGPPRPTGRTATSRREPPTRSRRTSRRR